MYAKILKEKRVNSFIYVKLPDAGELTLMMVACYGITVDSKHIGSILSLSFGGLLLFVNRGSLESLIISSLLY